MWDVRQKDAPVACFEPDVAGGGTVARDCWTVAFGNSYNDSERCVLAGCAGCKLNPKPYP